MIQAAAQSNGIDTVISRERQRMVQSIAGWPNSPFRLLSELQEDFAGDFNLKSGPTRTVMHLQDGAQTIELGVDALSV